MRVDVSFGFILDELDRLGELPDHSKGRNWNRVITSAVPKEDLKAFIQKVAYDTYTKSQILVPVDTGALKASGVVFEYEGEYVIRYYTTYAAYVHEIMSNRHAAPTQAKYVQDAFMSTMLDLTSMYGWNNIPEFDADLRVSVEGGVLLSLSLPEKTLQKSWRKWVTSVL